MTRVPKRTHLHFPRLTGQPNRPRLLVSVRDAQEAVLAQTAGADLIDAKDPGNGALGALPFVTVRAIVSVLGASAVTSAVAGEPEGTDDLVSRVAAMVSTGVGFVKVAIANTDGDDALHRAATAAQGRLIGVLFADDGAAWEIVPRLAAAGFCGAMIDTRGKVGRRLSDHLSQEALSDFVSACRRTGLLSGLAGSLRMEDVTSLAALGPDYLGFRGGLCRDGDRRNPLDDRRVAEIVDLLREAGQRDAA